MIFSKGNPFLEEIFQILKELMHFCQMKPLFWKKHVFLKESILQFVQGKGLSFKK